MHSLVHDQIILLGEAFFAEPAMKRFFPGVYAIMDLQFIAGSESFTAKVAKVSLFVTVFSVLVFGGYVLQQSVHFGKDF